MYRWWTCNVRYVETKLVKKTLFFTLFKSFSGHLDEQYLKYSTGLGRILRWSSMAICKWTQGPSWWFMLIMCCSDYRVRLGSGRPTFKFPLCHWAHPVTLGLSLSLSLIYLKGLCEDKIRMYTTQVKMYIFVQENWSSVLWHQCRSGECQDRSQFCDQKSEYCLGDPDSNPHSSMEAH